MSSIKDSSVKVASSTTSSDDAHGKRISFTENKGKQSMHSASSSSKKSNSSEKEKNNTRKTEKVEVMESINHSDIHDNDNTAPHFDLDAHPNSNDESEEYYN